MTEKVISRSRFALRNKSEKPADVFHASGQVCGGLNSEEKGTSTIVMLLNLKSDMDKHRKWLIREPFEF